MSNEKNLMPCSECSRQFTVKSNLTRHLRMVHNIQIERADTVPSQFGVYHYKCLEGCSISYKYNRDLRNHLREEHEFDLAEMNLEFPNAEEFKKWLHAEETNNYVQYVHFTATKRKSTGAETFYYECHRTGKYSTIQDTARKRKPRKNGTTKLNRGCTSQIIVNKSYGGIFSVNYFKSHYGHEIGLEHMKLSRRDRGAIASKLLLGVPVSSVLDSVQNTRGSNLKRINLLRRKDVFNIRRAFNITQKDGEQNERDSLNITSFIEECSTQSYNPILHYKVENLSESNDICLIIMTQYQAQMLNDFGNNFVVLNTTHLNNCDFELVTLFVVGSNGDSFPAACMFSNKSDYNIFHLFFTNIAKHIGKIEPNILLSNCDEWYSKAWEDVMGNVQYKLYDENQIDLDWKSNLNRILSADVDVNKVKRKWLYDTLKILQKTAEETEFLESLEETLKLLQNDDDFRDFLVYFMEHFSDTKKWAECYRANCNVVSKQLDVMTDVLKQYLNEGSEVRLDKIFQSLIRFLRDETVNSMLKNKANRAAFIQDNNIRHHSSVYKQFSSLILNDDFWNVTDTSSGRIYVVQKCLETKCCNLICSLCQCICIHCFSCTCVDFFLSNAICEHIHYIWITYFESVAINQQETQDSKDSDSYCDEEIIIEIAEDDLSNRENVELLRREIIEKTNILQDNISTFSNENTLKVILDSVNNLCNITHPPSDQNDEESAPGTVMTDHAYL